MDDNLAAKFETITRTILSNQTDALNTLTSKVEKDIGQVWRQMGIMYGQLSNSINIQGSNEFLRFPFRFHRVLPGSLVFLRDL